MPAKKDLTGKKFGKLTVLYENGFKYVGKQRKILWHCVCDCGNHIDVTACALTSGNTKSCGCYVKEAAFEKRSLNLVGRRFGRLIVTKMIPGGNGKRVSCECKCDCGNTYICSSTNLMQGKIISCGCYKDELIKTLHITHGESHTRLYRVWQGMRERCYSETHISYEWYGARGITVCDDWLNSYENFKVWAESNGYDWNAKRGECTLDRIDVDKEYSPENCRWVDMATQNKNKRIS